MRRFPIFEILQVSKIESSRCSTYNDPALAFACRFFAFLDAENLAAGPVAKAGPEKKNLRVFEYWKFRKNSLKTVTVDSFKEEITVHKVVSSQHFCFANPGAPFELTRYTSRLICRTPSMEIGFKDIYWK